MTPRPPSALPDVPASRCGRALLSKPGLPRQVPRPRASVPDRRSVLARAVHEDATAGAEYGGGAEASLGALVRCARDGDPLAFRSVAERLGPELVRFVMRFTGQGRDFANDVVQDALVAAWCNLDGIRDDDHIRPWLYRVARFKAVDRLRRRGPGGVAMTSLDVGLAMEIEPPAPSASDPADGATTQHAAMRAAMSRAFAAMPPNYIGAVRLHYLHGMPVSETAKLLGLPKPTVKMRLHRARRRLRRILRRELRRIDHRHRGEGAPDGSIET